MSSPAVMQREIARQKCGLEFYGAGVRICPYRAGWCALGRLLQAKNSGDFDLIGKGGGLEGVPSRDGAGALLKEKMRGRVGVVRTQGAVRPQGARQRNSRVNRAAERSSQR